METLIAFHSKNNLNYYWGQFNTKWDQIHTNIEMAKNSISLLLRQQNVQSMLPMGSNRDKNRIRWTLLLHNHMFSKIIIPRSEIRIRPQLKRLRHPNFFPRVSASECFSVQRLIQKFRFQLEFLFFMHTTSLGQSYSTRTLSIRRKLVSRTLLDFRSAPTRIKNGGMTCMPFFQTISKPHREKITDLHSIVNLFKP